MRYYCKSCNQVIERDSNENRLKSICASNDKDVVLIKIDYLIESLCKKHIKASVDLSTFKKKEIAFIEAAFIQGANVMMNYLSRNK